MIFKVISPDSHHLSNVKDGTVFFLRQDNWNDYHYKTQYHLYLSGEFTDDNETISIGDVKILKRGQKERSGLQLEVGTLNELDNDFCSLGQSLDFYERIANIDSELRDKLLKGLRDIVIYPENKIGFESEDGFSKSLMRDIEKDDDIFNLSPILISKDYQKLPSIDLNFSFQTEGMDVSIPFSFDSPNYSHSKKLPSRVIVLVGRNGSGKSTLLSKISRVAFASGSDRKDISLKKVGTFIPSGLGFPKIINISYSAFDSFQVPGIYKHEKEQISKDISQNNGRYIFCGIRDICKELEISLENINTNERGKLSEADILNDRQTFTHLKPIEALANEIKTLLTKIDEDSKLTLLEDALSILSKEYSFKAIKQTVRDHLSEKSIIDLFMGLSTGHKFALHSIINIVAHTERRSFVLFDEPEVHLHPPLLAVLMSAIRFILEEQDAFAIVATHSPVIVQETLSKHVYIIRREGQYTKVIKPDIETYGEDIGTITSYVFELSSEITDFHYELDNVLKAMKSPILTDKQIMDKCEELFPDGLSMQARAYLFSKIINENK